MQRAGREIPEFGVERWRLEADASRDALIGGGRAAVAVTGRTNVVANRCAQRGIALKRARTATKTVATLLLFVRPAILCLFLADRLRAHGRIRLHVVERRCVIAAPLAAAASGTED